MLVKRPELENLWIINLGFFNICDALPFTLLLHLLIPKLINCINIKCIWKSNYKLFLVPNTDKFTMYTVLSWFTLFQHKIYFVGIFALYCGEKLTQKSCLGRNNDKYDAWLWSFSSPISRLTGSPTQISAASIWPLPVLNACPNALGHFFF